MSAKLTFNVEKIHDMSSLNGATSHNSLKTLDGEQHIPSSHFNLDRQKLNIHKGNAYKTILKMKEKVPFPKNKNTNPAVEIVLAASPEWYLDKNSKEITQMLMKQVEWAKEFYKDDGLLVQYDIHYTESTPHVQLIFAPVSTKITYKTELDLDADGNKQIKNANQLKINPNAQVKYKRKQVIQDDGTKVIKKVEKSWSSDKFQGGKWKMANARTSQYEFMKAEGYDLERGATNFYDYMDGKISKEDYLTKVKESDDGIGCTAFLNKQIKAATQLEKHIDGLKVTKALLQGEIEIPKLEDFFNTNISNPQRKLPQSKI